MAEFEENVVSHATRAETDTKALLNELLLLKYDRDNHDAIRHHIRFLRQLTDKINYSISEIEFLNEKPSD